MTFTYSQSFMLDCVTNKCEREGREGKNNDSINNLRTREALDCEKREMEKKARSDLAAEKYVTRYLTYVFSQTFYSRGV